MIAVSYFLCSGFVGFVVFYPNLLWIFLLCFIFIAAILLAISGTITAQIMLSMKRGVRHATVLSYFGNFHKYIQQNYNAHIHKGVKRLPVVFGRSVDIALQDLLDLLVKDLISPWLEDLALCSKELQYSIK